MSDINWTSLGEGLYRDGRKIALLPDNETAAWVAEACEMHAMAEAAQAEWLASDEGPHCTMVEIGGQPMRLQLSADIPEALKAAMFDVVRTVQGQRSTTRRDRMVERAVLAYWVIAGGLATVIAVLAVVGLTLAYGWWVAALATVLVAAVTTYVFWSSR